MHLSIAQHIIRLFMTMCIHYSLYDKGVLHIRVRVVSWESGVFYFIKTLLTTHVFTTNNFQYRICFYFYFYYYLYCGEQMFNGMICVSWCFYIQSHICNIICSIAVFIQYKFQLSYCDCKLFICFDMYFSYIVQFKTAA